MGIQMTINKGRVPVHVWTRDIDSKAIDQLTNIAQLPFVKGHVAAMPDVHVGLGATVGSVIPTVKAIIPASVGVDIGCGMMAARLTLPAHQLPDSLGAVRSAIEAKVPVGFNLHSLENACSDGVKKVKDGHDRITEKHPKLAERARRGKPWKWARQIGTLGGGNHFIELCLDQDQRVWVMLHSGSRGVGNEIGRYFISMAKEEMLRKDVRLPDKDLAYLEEGSQSFSDYVEAVDWAQDYAMENRRQMMRLVLEALAEQLPEFSVTDQAINCHHNYIAREVHFGEHVYVTRKGAIRAGKDELGIIPGSMGARSYIVRGKGNGESLHSCAHGAGRKMSRTEAKRRFTRADLIDQTKGVECRKDKGVIDEAPGAYKDIDAVMSNQEDLVEVVHTLKQVVCVKG